MATFRVDFLGCKVSHVDAHEVREALLARRARRGRRRRRRRRDQHLLRHERGAREDAQGRRRAPPGRTRASTSPAAARTSAGDAFAGLPENVVVVAKRSEETAAFVAGDVGAIGCVQADARLDRVRAFVKIQDGCSFSCNFCVIPLVRGGSRSRSAAAVLGRDRTARRAGSSRGRADGHQPRLLSRPRRTATTCRGSSARRGRRRGSSGCGSARSRSTTSTQR